MALVRPGRVLGPHADPCSLPGAWLVCFLWERWGPVSMFLMGAVVAWLVCFLWELWSSPGVGRGVY